MQGPVITATPADLLEFASKGAQVHAWKWLDRNGAPATGPSYGGVLRLTKRRGDQIVTVYAAVPDLVPVAHLLPAEVF